MQQALTLLNTENVIFSALNVNNLYDKYSLQYWYSFCGLQTRAPVVMLRGQSRAMMRSRESHCTVVELMDGCAFMRRRRKRKRGKGRNSSSESSSGIDDDGEGVTSAGIYTTQNEESVKGGCSHSHSRGSVLCLQDVLRVLSSATSHAGTSSAVTFVTGAGLVLKPRDSREGGRRQLFDDEGGGGGMDGGAGAGGGGGGRSLIGSSRQDWGALFSVCKAAQTDGVLGVLTVRSMWRGLAAVVARDAAGAAGGAPVATATVHATVSSLITASGPQQWDQAFFSLLQLSCDLMGLSVFEALVCNTPEYVHSDTAGRDHEGGGGETSFFSEVGFEARNRNVWGQHLILRDMAGLVAAVEGEAGTAKCAPTTAAGATDATDATVHSASCVRSFLHTHPHARLQLAAYLLDLSTSLKEEEGTESPLALKALALNNRMIYPDSDWTFKQDEILGTSIKPPPALPYTYHSVTVVIFVPAADVVYTQEIVHTVWRKQACPMCAVVMNAVVMSIDVPYTYTGTDSANGTVDLEADFDSYLRGSDDDDDDADDENSDAKRYTEDMQFRYVCLTLKDYLQRTMVSSDVVVVLIGVDALLAMHPPGSTGEQHASTLSIA
jgi:hypothetical protein